MQRLFVHRRNGIRRCNAVYILESNFSEVQCACVCYLATIIITTSVHAAIPLLTSIKFNPVSISVHISRHAAFYAETGYEAVTTLRETLLAAVTVSSEFYYQICYLVI